MNNHEQIVEDRAVFGFWIYLMTDLLMFAALFATFAVLRNNTADGPTGAEIFNLRFVLTETIILLVSSFTCGMATLALGRSDKKAVISWFVITFLLGATFLIMELSEFSKLFMEGNSWQRSAFLSSYFSLVGAHGMHIAVGLLWMLISVGVVWFKGLTEKSKSKLVRLSLFWHFLDVVWIFIFTIVYLRGVM